LSSRQLARKIEVSARMKETQRNLQTDWRIIQSVANFSPVRFPVNREKYREYCVPGVSIRGINPGMGAHYRKKTALAYKSEQGRIRELTGKQQGMEILFPDFLGRTRRTVPKQVRKQVGWVSVRTSAYVKATADWTFDVETQVFPKARITGVAILLCNR
jgi:hypothetical protein